MGPDSGTESSPVTVSGNCTQTCQGVLGYCRRHSILQAELGVISPIFIYGKRVWCGFAVFLKLRCVDYLLYCFGVKVMNYCLCL